MPREMTVLGPTLVGDAEFRPAAEAVGHGTGLRLERDGLVGRFSDAEGRVVAAVQHPRRIRSESEVRRLLSDIVELPAQAEGGGWWWTDVFVPLHDEDDGTTLLGAEPLGVALARSIAEHAGGVLSGSGEQRS